MKLLLIGDDRKNQRMYAWGFSAEPFRAKLASTLQGVEDALADDAYHVACVDFKMQEEDVAKIVEMLHRRVPELPIVLLVGAADKKAASAYKDRGVVAHLVSPFSIESLHAVVRDNAAADPVGGPRRFREPIAEPVPAAPLPVLPKLLASDAPAQRTVELALRAANSNAAILILGETGTGKSVLAQAIHQHSPLSQRPFVTVNCPCLNRELLESDLFGHVRGSFTGAVQDTWGKVAAAEGGTLFLDEIGDLPMELQPKLLRLLQEKQYERVGETAPRSANVRIIAATNKDLKREVAEGRFREDLYYRLNVIAIEAPPLRHRPAQILGAAEAVLGAVCRELGKPNPGFTLEARRVLESYGWPGNLRELRNVIERAAILSDGSALDRRDFPALVAQPVPARLEVGSPISLHRLEAAHIQLVVANAPTLDEAARILQIDKSTLYRKRKAMEAHVEKFAPVTNEIAVAAG